MPTDFDNVNYAGFPAGGNKKTIKELQNEAVRNFVQKLKIHFEGDNKCFIYSDGYVGMGGKINEEINELLKEYEQ